MTRAIWLLFMVYPTLAMFASFVAIQHAANIDIAVLAVGGVWLVVSGITAGVIIRREAS